MKRINFEYFIVHLFQWLHLLKWLVLYGIVLLVFYLQSSSNETLSLLDIQSIFKVIYHHSLMHLSSAIFIGFSCKLSELHALFMTLIIKFKLFVLKDRSNGRESTKNYAIKALFGHNYLLFFLWFNIRFQYIPRNYIFMLHIYLRWFRNKIVPTLNLQLVSRDVLEEVVKVDFLQ